MRKEDFLQRYAALQPRTKFLLGLWLLFFILVAAGIHGAPTPILSKYWPSEPYSGYFFGSLDNKLQQRFGSQSFDSLMLTVPQVIRSDDFIIRFPLALSQLSHHPRFPVVNTNYWTGRNMLVFPQYDVPVLHIAALVRPGSWGYFFLGAQRGVAWEWWFQTFACFTVLFLLLEIILQGHPGLAAFGAFWFCGSAGVVCFGYWPTYTAFFGALAVLSFYHIFHSTNRRIQILCGALLGLSSTGFFLLLYPPWQISLGYLFALILISLIVRDRLYRSMKSINAGQVIACAIALAIAVLIIVAFLHSTWNDLKTMVATIYPGQRRGGSAFPLWFVFGGFYNLISSYNGLTATFGHYRFQINPTEAASFYLLFPAVFAPLALSRKWRTAFGVLGWTLLGYSVLLLALIKHIVPMSVVRFLLFDRVISNRLVMPLGLASIIICVLALSKARQLQPREKTEKTYRNKLIPILSGVTIAVICLIAGLSYATSNNSTPQGQMILFASLYAGYAGYCLIDGRAKQFCALAAIAVIAVASIFNPLSTNLDYIYKTDLAREIQKLNQQYDRPLWLCYGPNDEPGTIVAILGGRTFTGVQWPPPMDLWHKFDPSRRYESAYNRYAHVNLEYTTDSAVSFSSAGEQQVTVTISPDNAILKSMGAKYIFAQGDYAKQIDTKKYPLIYSPASGAFAIFEIPQ